MPLSLYVYTILKKRNSLPFHSSTCSICQPRLRLIPSRQFGTVVGENPTPCGILALWAVNGLSIVHWVVKVNYTRQKCYAPI